MIPDNLQKIGDESTRLLLEVMAETIHGSPDPAQTLAKADRGKKLSAEFRRGMRELIRETKAEIALRKAAATLGESHGEACPMKAPINNDAIRRDVGGVTCTRKPRPPC